MSRIDKTRPFIAVRIAVLTVSDTRLAEDKSGDLLVSRQIIYLPLVISAQTMLTLLPNSLKDLSLILKLTVSFPLAVRGLPDVMLPPKRSDLFLKRKIEGFGEMFRFLSFQKIGTSTLQSRAVAGVAGGTYLFALPGSPSACRDAWDDLLAHQLDYRHQPL